MKVDLGMAVGTYINLDWLHVLLLFLFFAKKILSSEEQLPSRLYIALPAHYLSSKMHRWP
jgi:hypothetical protein